MFQEGKSDRGFDHYEHRSWTAWHRHVRLLALAQLFLVRLQIKFKEKAPALTLPQARLLLEGSFPQSKSQRGYRLLLVNYHEKRNDQTYRSHRKRANNKLKKWKSLKTSR